MNQPHCHRLLNEVPLGYFKLGNMSVQRLQIEVLPRRSIGVIRAGGYSGGVILDLQYVVFRPENGLEKRLDVEPFVGGALQGTVLEVEAVNVDIRPHDGPQKKQRPVGCPTGLAPHDRSRGGSGASMIGTDRSRFNPYL